MEFGTFNFVDVGADAPAANFLDLLELRDVNTAGAGYPAAGVGETDNGCAEFLGLFDGVDGDVTGAGNDDLGAGEGCTVGCEHFLGEVDQTVAGCFGTHQGATPGQALAGENAGFVLVSEATVLPEEVADFAATNADVAGRDVPVFADMAEAHDFRVRLAFGVEVGATLAAADGQAGEGVFEDLLEAEELDDAQVNGGVETQAALVGADCGVELDAETAVDLNDAFVVYPRDAEHELALGFAEALDESVVGVVEVFFEDDLEGVEHLGDGLVEFGLAGVALEQHVVVAGDLLFDGHVRSVCVCHVLVQSPPGRRVGGGCSLPILPTYRN